MDGRRAPALVLVLVVCTSTMLGACDERRFGIGPGPPPPTGGSFARADWRVPIPSSYTGPTVDDSTVYFSSARHEVYALRKSDGTRRWISMSIGLNFPIGHSLHFAQNLVLYPEFDLHAFDAATGVRAWVFSDSGHAAGGFSTLSSDSSKVYGGSRSGVVVAVNLRDGTLAWRTHVSTDTGQVNVYSPLVSGGRVFAGYIKYSLPFSGGIVALDAATGAALWRRDLPPVTPDLWGGAYDGLVVWQDLVIVASQDGRVTAFRSDSGFPVWTAPRPAGLGTGVNDSRPLAIVGDVVVVGSTLELVQGLDARTGSVVWSRGTEGRGSINYPITSIGNTFLLLYTSLQVARLVGATGSTLWETGLNFEPYLFVRPAFDSSRVFVAGDSGFYALRR